MQEKKITKAPQRMHYLRWESYVITQYTEAVLGVELTVLR
jgi:hypothetical protein